MQIKRIIIFKLQPVFSKGSSIPHSLPFAYSSGWFWLEYVNEMAGSEVVQTIKTKNEWTSDVAASATRWNPMSVLEKSPPLLFLAFFQISSLQHCRGQSWGWKFFVEEKGQLKRVTFTSAC